MSSTLNILNKKATARVCVNYNDVNKGFLQATESGYFGLYDHTNSAYLIKRGGTTSNEISIATSDVYDSSVSIGSKKATVLIDAAKCSISHTYLGQGYIYAFETDVSSEFKLIGANSVNNIHIGNYDGADTMQVYMHAHGGEFAFDTTMFRPKGDNTYVLGNSTHRWKQLYAGTTTISTSDKNLKKNIKNIDPKKLQLLLNLSPREFMFKTGDRTHTGLIAQELEEEMIKLGLSSEDIGALCKDIIYEYDYNEEDGTEIESSKRPTKDSDGNIVYRYGARYEELITPILALVQILWKKVFGDLSYRDE